MSVDCMRVRLHLRLIRVLAVLVDTVDELVVEVTSTRSWSRCPDCGFRCRAVHDTRGSQGPGSALPGTADDVVVAAPPVRVRQLRSAPPRDP